MRRRALVLVWLVFVWVLLWGDLTIANVVGGVLAGVVVIAVVGTVDSPRPWRVWPAGVLVFVAVFAREWVRANLVVLRQVLTWRNERFRSAVLAYPAAPLPPQLLAVLGDLITLTPGTMTLEVRPEEHVLYVHLLHVDDPAEAIKEMQVLERIVVRAFARREDAAAAREHWQREPSWTS